jgi:hypothetical protein
LTSPVFIQIRKEYDMVMTATKQQLTPEQARTLGRLLVEIFNGDIKENTRKQVCVLAYKEIRPPLNHLVSWIQGSSQSNHDLTKSMLEEVGIICSEVLKKMETEDPV